ncbi:MAG: hypothetical protein HQL12_01140 [Candidatus Omnitrophica bacterium]|nr:hypothetical protein [Candidatus Omnitrophota bacterium]
MDFKKLFSKKVLVPFLFGIFAIIVTLWRLSPRTNLPAPESLGAASEMESMKVISARPVAVNPSAETGLKGGVESGTPKEDDAAIQQQLDRDRQEQKQTKYLKNKLEQTNLELEQEKALAQINKLKSENRGNFKDPSVDGQKNMPEIKVEYIGGDNVKKEAILSIAGVSFQVKEKSSPTDSIQVLSISDTGVTLHFSAPQELTKTIDYKPE